MKVALGIGCDRGTPEQTLAQAVQAALAHVHANHSDVLAVASVDLKANETGLLALAIRLGWTIVFYPPAQLAQVVVPNPSETVRRYTGTPSVSEAAALLAAGQTGLPAPTSALRLEKLKLRGPDGKNATVSVAAIF